VVAMARPQAAVEALAEAGCQVLRGSALEAAEVNATVAAFAAAGTGAAACVSTMGGGPPGRSADFLGNAQVVDALAAAGLRRLVLVTSLGAGDSRASASPRLLTAIGPVLEEKTRAEQHAAAADLALTVVRPARLLAGPATGQARLIEDPSVHGRINRVDLAGLLLACLEDAASIGRTYSAVDPSLPGPLPPVAM